MDFCVRFGVSGIVALYWPGPKAFLKFCVVSEVFLRVLGKDVLAFFGKIWEPFCVVRRWRVQAAFLTLWV